MARSRQLAVMDFFLVAVLLVLIYVFISRMGYMPDSASEGPGGTEEDRKALLPQVDSARSLDDAIPAGAPDIVDMDHKGFPNVQEEMVDPGMDIEEGKRKAVELFDEMAHRAPLKKTSRRKQKDTTAEDEKVREEIDARLKKIVDMRSEPCRRLNHDAQVAASIIIDFFDYQLYDLKVTIGSVLRFTPLSLLREIVIVDDGSTLEYLIKEAQVYVAGIPKAVLVRNEDRQGRMLARLRGAKEADGHNLIFLDTTVIVSTGWVEPLVEHIQVNKASIAVPHFDKINDPISYEYVPVKGHLFASFSWSLTVRVRQGPDVYKDDETRPFNTPMIHGAVFAVTKEYFDQIGKYDVGLSDGGGEHLELSLRTWMCGGSIKVVPCSRVGMLNINDPVKLNSFPNVFRITEVWLKAHKSLVKSYFDGDFEKDIDESKRTLASQRIAEIRGMKCANDIKWFVNNVAKDMYAPSPNATKFGFMRVSTRLCATVGKDNALDLGSCKPSEKKLLPAQMTFELLKNGEIRANGKCLECMDNAYTLAQTCKGNGDPKQLWKYTNGLLVNKWSRYCLMHVTDPDPKKKDKHRQIAMAQPCELDTTDKKEFSSWDFLKG